MKKIKLSLVLMAIPFISFGQANEFYYTSFTVVYLPSSGGQSESYYKNKGKNKHSLLTTKWERKIKVKNRRLKNDRKILNTINSLDSLFRLSEFKFSVNKSIIDSLKADKFWQKNDNISLTDIDNFFSLSDTVLLKLKDLAKKPPRENNGFLYLEIEPAVIDGAPYNFNLQIKKTNQDTIKYQFDGNLYDGVQLSNIKNWLPFYLIRQKEKIFSSLPLNYYFGNENLKGVLESFIYHSKLKEG